MTVVNTTDKQFLTVKEVQDILRIGQVTAYHLVNTANFPKIKIGRCYRIPVTGFWEWVKTQHPKQQQELFTADTSCILDQLKLRGRRRT